MNKPIIIGIAGGSASGKTTIAETIMEKFKEEKKVVIIRQDDYYKDQSHMPFEERVKTNYDHPFAFDNDYMVSQVKELASGHSILKPTYDFVHHTRSEITETVDPADVIILEGLFVLENEDCRISRSSLIHLRMSVLSAGWSAMSTNGEERWILLSHST